MSYCIVVVSRALLERVLYYTCFINYLSNTTIHSETRTDNWWARFAPTNWQRNCPPKTINYYTVDRYNRRRFVEQNLLSSSVRNIWERIAGPVHIVFDGRRINKNATTGRIISVVRPPYIWRLGNKRGDSSKRRCFHLVVKKLTGRNLFARTVRREYEFLVIDKCRIQNACLRNKFWCCIMRCIWCLK